MSLVAYGYGLGGGGPTTIFQTIESVEVVQQIEVEIVTIIEVQLAAPIEVEVT